MAVNFQIQANQQDITKLIQDRLLALRITNEAGMVSDTVELSLDDRNNKIAWPEKNAQLKISIGFKNKGLVSMGTYIVDELEHTGPPATLTIRAKAADMIASLKSPQTRSWDEVKLGDLITSIATKHGLTAKVSSSLASIKLSHLTQTQESDLHLLTRLAKNYDAITKPVSGCLIFLTQGEAKAASGQELPATTINANKIINHRMVQSERYQYKSVKSYWHDIGTATKYSVIAGHSEPAYTLRQTYNNADDAKHAAQAKLKAFNRGVGMLSLTLIGQLTLQAASKIILTNIREPIAGEWLITRVLHQLNAQGFTTQLDAELPNT